MDVEMRLFFLDWAMRNQVKATPRSTVRLFDGEVAIMGFVPNNPDGSIVELHAKQKAVK